MLTFDINWLALLVAIVGSFLLGWIYYGPLFQKPWMELTGMTEEKAKKGMAKGMGLGLVSMVLIGFFMAQVIAWFGVSDLMGGLELAFWVWLGFAMPSSLMKYGYEQLSMKLFAIDMGYQLINLLVMGAILAVWM